MIYKRATKMLLEAGINDIVIVKSLWGPTPENTRAIAQTSKCFKTWKRAVQAVIDGYRPEVHKFKAMSGKAGEEAKNANNKKNV